MADRDNDGRDRAGNGIQAIGDAALTLSASLARSIAEGLSGRPQPPVAGETRIGGIARHGTNALGSLVAMTMAAAREAGLGLGTNTPPPAAETAPPPTAAAGIARLMPGASLRLPLSIDNPGSQPMERLAPHALGARFEGADCAAPFALRFDPPSLSIAPRDFEKLVVTIDLPPEMPPGRWSALFALGPDAPAPHDIAFLVLPPGD